MQTPRPLHEIRLLFAAAVRRKTSFCVSLTDGEGYSAIGVEQSFTPFLSDADYENLRWYLEEYMELPDGGAVIRAAKIEAELAEWGRRLHDAIFSAHRQTAPRSKQILAAPEPRELTIASSDARSAAPALGTHGRCCRQARPARLAAPPARRPRNQSSAAPARCRCASSTSSAAPRYRLHRPALHRRRRCSPRSTRSAKPCSSTSAARRRCRASAKCCAQAQQAGKDYDVVHFDGHGTFLPEMQIGALCFEQSDDGSGDSQTDLVAADRLGDLLAQHRIPLVVLEACRSATVGKTLVFRSVAPRLLQAGVGSVVAMGHAVHVEAARILLDRFYRELASGTSIGHAVAQGRSALAFSPAALARKRPRGAYRPARRLVPAAALPARPR
jgi:hypothetical protein